MTRTETSAARSRARITDHLADQAQAAVYASIMARSAEPLPWWETGDITMIDEFCGLGGNSWGARLVRGVRPIAGFNHMELAARSWELNHPGAEGVCADVTTYPVEQMPWCHFYAGSPACPPFGDAAGLPRIFDSRSANQPSLLEGLAEGGEDTRNGKREAERARGRLLMYEPVKYLRHWVSKGRPVPVGFLENVPEARLWSEWDELLGEIHKMRYRTYLLAVRADHVQPVRALDGPQARNRLFLAFVHESVGRFPDFDKWIRPQCWCPVCDGWVSGVQTWKGPGLDMGEYGEQYLFRCPNHAGGAPVIVEPLVKPALSFLDRSDRGVAIGDPIRSQRSRWQPLADSTILRVAGGGLALWRPLLAGDPSGSGLLPMVASFRGGGDLARSRSASQPLSVVTSKGRHHGIAFPPEFEDAEMRSWAKSLLVPYYGAATGSRSPMLPVGTLTTKPRYGVARVANFDAWLSGIAGMSGVEAATIKEILRAVKRKEVTAAQRRIIDGLRELLGPVLFRMMNLEEHQLAMGFGLGVRSVATTIDDWILLLGNAVVPAVAEVITSALVECLTGEELPRELVAA